MIVEPQEGKLFTMRAIGLSKRFQALPVLRQLDLELAPGQSVAVMGDNGTGKTTLLRCLAGVVRPDSGQIGCQSGRLKRGAKLSSFVGMAAHESQLYPNLTLLENLLFAGRMHAVAQPQRQAEAWLDRINLASHSQCLPSQVSHGMRRRVSVARALIHQPQIVLLDEPFSGLDSTGRDWLAQLLADLQRINRSICFTTHHVEQAQRCADRVLELQSGKLRNVSVVHHATHSNTREPRLAA